MDICEDIELYLKEDHSIEEKLNWKGAKRGAKNLGMAAAMAATMGSPTKGHAQLLPTPTPTPTEQTNDGETSGRYTDASEIENGTPKIAELSGLYWDKDGELEIHGNMKVKFNPDKTDLVGYDSLYNEIDRVNAFNTHGNMFEIEDNGVFFTRLSDPEKKIKFLAFVASASTDAKRQSLSAQNPPDRKTSGGKVDASFFGINDVGSDDGGRARILSGKINMGTVNSLDADNRPDKLVLVMYDANHSEIYRLNMKTEKYFSLGDDGEFSLGLPNNMKWKKIKFFSFINQP
jgi:hypothetical protein